MKGLRVRRTLRDGEAAKVIIQRTGGVGLATAKTSGDSRGGLRL